MNRFPVFSRSFRVIAGNVFLALAYIGVAHLSLVIHSHPHGIPVFVPVLGLAVAAVTVFGGRAVPGVFAGSLVYNLGTQTGSHAVSLAIFIAFDAALQSWLAAYLLDRFVGVLPPWRANRVLRATLLLAFSSCLTPLLGLIGTWVARPALRSGVPDLVWGVWIGTYSGILLVAPGLIVAVEFWRRRPVREPLIWPLASGLVGLALVMFLMAWTFRNREFASRLTDDTTGMARVMRETVRETQGSVTALRAFYSASETVQQEEFQRFSQTLLDANGSLHALAWAPRVAARDRESFESSHSVILEKAAGGTLVSAGVRAEYFPLAFLSHRSGESAALGFDEGSDAERLQVLVRARDNGVPQLSPQVLLPETREQRSGFILAAAAYQGGEVPDTVTRRLDFLEGYAIGFLGIDGLLKAALVSLHARDVDVYLFDVTERRPRFLAFHSLHSGSRLAGGKERQPDLFQLESEPVIQASVSVEVLGRTWKLVSRPGEGYDSGGRAVGVWIRLIFGLLSAGVFLLFVASRQRSEARLKEAERQYRTLVEQSPAIVYVDEVGGRWRYVSPKVESILGYTPEDFLTGRVRWLDCVHPDERERVKSVTYGSLEEGAEIRLEYRMQSRTGAFIWVHDHAKVSRDKPNNVWLLRGVMYDITTRKRGEIERQLLFDIVHAAASARGLDGFLPRVHEALRAALFAENFFVLVHNPAIGLFESIYWVDQNDPPPPPRDLGRGCSAFVFRTGETHVITPEVFSGLESRGEVVRIGTHAASWLGAPLKSGFRVTGVMAVQDYERPGRYGERERDLFALAAAHVGLAIERWRAEEAVRKSEARYRLVTENTGDVIWAIDAATLTFSFLSPSVEQMLGYKPQELIGKSAAAFTTQASREKGGAVMERWGRSPGQPPLIMEMEQIRKDGSVIHAEIKVSIVTDEMGRQQLVGVSRDITERKRAEIERRAAQKALAENEARLVEAQRMAHIGVWELDLRDKRFSISDEALRILGIDPGPALPAPGVLLDATHPEDRSQIVRILEEPAGTEEPREVDHRFVLPDGKTKWVKLRFRHELGAGGEAVRLTATMQDLTEQLLAREAEALAKAKEAAESANKAKSVFLASMSHEIRTPMNSILGFSQLLLGDSNLTAHEREQVESIQRAGEHLLDLINDVLEMSKIEAGRTATDLAVTDLHALLEDLRTMFRVRVREKALYFAVERSGDLPHFIVTDEKKLRQILFNLTGNAVKFTSDGGVRVRARTETEEGHMHLLVDVEDSGPGIAGEDIPRLFQRFEQTRVGREASTGTGLGLAISRAFARLLGGDISVKSRVGEGSVFSLILPITLAETEAVGTRTETRRVVGLPQEEQNRRILVADDLPENREILCQMLARAGFDVSVVEDGAQAVKAFEKWHPDLILMDLRMPGTDGLQAMRTIRREEKGGHIPIVAVTASAFEDDRQDVRSAGGDAFVSKPFREAELLQTVGRLLGLHYIYEERPDAHLEDTGPSPVRRVSIPSHLRAALRAAVVSADFAKILELADELLITDMASAEVVRDLAERFEYERLLAFLEENG